MCILSTVLDIKYTQRRHQPIPCVYVIKDKYMYNIHEVHSLKQNQHSKNSKHTLNLKNNIQKTLGILCHQAKTSIQVDVSIERFFFKFFILQRASKYLYQHIIPSHDKTDIDLYNILHPN